MQDLGSFQEQTWERAPKLYKAEGARQQLFSSWGSKDAIQAAMAGVSSRAARCQPVFTAKKCAPLQKLLRPVPANQTHWRLARTWLQRAARTG